MPVLPGPARGLGAPDVFYFGHLDGDAGGDTSPLRAGASDLAVVRRAMARLVGMTDPADFNRDGRIDARAFAAASADHRGDRFTRGTHEPHPGHGEAAGRLGRIGLTDGQRVHFPVRFVRSPIVRVV